MRYRAKDSVRCIASRADDGAGEPGCLTQGSQPVPGGPQMMLFTELKQRHVSISDAILGCQSINEQLS